MMAHKTSLANQEIEKQLREIKQTIADAVGKKKRSEVPELQSH